MIDEKLFVDLRQYLLSKTGILYFGRIKQLPTDLMISCPFHKEGQERKPSCGVKLVSDDKGTAGTVHCFSCGITTNISLMVQEILGSQYNEDEVEARFHLKEELASYSFNKPKQETIFKLPEKTIVSEKILRTYRHYHPYLESRGITQETAQKYDIGFDSFSSQITFPIRDIKKECIGVGRRSIKGKRYIYPAGMIKPLYGVYELPKFIRYIWIVEGPFNLWSLYGWGKTGVALLGTGTENQYKQLLSIKCDGYVLALDPDLAGITGTKKLIKFLLTNNKSNINVALLPTGKDINDLTHTEFKNLQVTTYKDWLYINGLKLNS